jgi:hypothetical protein
MMSKPHPLIKPISIDDSYIQQVFNYYQQCYQQDNDTQIFVQHSSRIADDFRCSEHIGLCDRTLGKHMQAVRTLTGGAMRGSLKRSGILLPSGHELFRGCVVFLTIDKHEQVISAIGYRYGERIHPWQSAVIHWNKPESNNYVNQGYALIKEMVYG